MKTFLVIVLFPALAFCQGFLPRWEMSLSGDLNSQSSKVQIISLEFRPGFYPLLGEGLSIEPELAYGRINGINAFNLSGNVSYSYGMGYLPFVPFVLAGYGLGDGIPFYQPMPREYVSGSTDVSVLNLGGGLKIMAFGGRALLRLEYRYQGFSENLKATRTVRAHTNHVFGRRLLLGFSILL
jgi:hypothetical protein